jgi:hypothetical protein
MTTTNGKIPAELGDPVLEQRIEQRLAELEKEFESGQQMLAELEAREAGLRETLLRLSGAITVLREMQTAGAPAENGAMAAGVS